jgi:L-asparaginase II
MEHIRGSLPEIVHAGAIAVVNAQAMENHLAPEHPLQQAIHRSIMQDTKANTAQLIAGTDGVQVIASISRQ